MTHKFNPITRQITVQFTTDEWDLLMAIRHAAAHYMSPFTESSGLAQLVRDLDKINHESTLERIK